MASRRAEASARSALAQGAMPVPVEQDDERGNADEGVVGDIRVEAGPASSPSARLWVRGLNVSTRDAAEKEKVSLTLDRQLVEEIRSQYGGRALSTSINELLHAALAQERLRELVDDMEREAGQPSHEAYERVMAQWLADD